MKKITTRTAIIYLDDDSILHIDMLDGVKVDYEDAVDNGLVIKNLLNGQRALKLIDARSDFSIDKKAREYINHMDVRQTLARAVVKSSKWNSLLQNFFNTLGNPKIPTKVFQSYEEAHEWLLQMRDELPPGE